MTATCYVAAHQLVGITPVHGDAYDEQLRWPLRLAGFGLTSAVAIAPAAYLAGLACTLPISPAFAAVWHGDAELDPSWPLYHAVANSIQRVTAMEAPLIAECPPDLLDKVSKSLLPDDAGTFVRHTRAMPSSCLIQSAVTHRYRTWSCATRWLPVRGTQKARDS